MDCEKHQLTAQSDLSTSDKVRDYWDLHPCDYDKGKSFEEIDTAVKKLYPYLARELAINSDSGKIILEIGIGSGTAACMSLTMGNPARYIMVDISKQTCKIAGAHLNQHYKKRNFDIFNYDAGSLPVATASIDRVKSLGVLHHIPHVEQVISEISRVLKPGGEVIFMFYNENSSRFKQTWHGSYDEMMRCTDGADNPYTKLYTANSIQELLKSHGIKWTRFAWREDGFALYVNGVKK